MKSLCTFFTLSLIALVAIVGLTGCSGLNGFPDASINPEHNSLGSIQGNNYGGHAPLIGSHVYVLQPSVTTAAGTAASPQYNAYGQQATSLLTANSSTVQNSSDPSIPTTWYYQTTDATGSFNISGDYTCTVGLPVYLYLYGGSPTFPSASNVFQINQVVVSNLTGTGTAETATYTLTTTTTENFYIGEQITFSNFTGTFAGGNGTSGTVLSTNLTTTTFAVTESDANGTVAAGTYPTTGTVTASPTFNPGVVNLAVLGVCPSSGNFSTGATALKYVYVNEVATVAAAYAFAPFTINTGTTTNNATMIGTSSTNIVGIQNAALMAGQLYDIEGSNSSTTYAGEGHIARPKTTAGNGILPQSSIDTLGNILAACVDSQNTSTTLGSGSISPQCTALFTNATNTGIPTTSTGTGANAPGVQPFDTATAALNIARHPGGPPYSYSTTGASSFMSALYGLPTGNVPFAPYLTVQPNDFTIGILYNAANNPGPGNDGLTTSVESLAVDKIGNVWFNTLAGDHYFFEFSPVGVAMNINRQTNYKYGYVTVDSGESAWTGANNSTDVITYVHATSTPATTSGAAPVTYTYAAAASATVTGGNVADTYAAVSDASGNVYFGNDKTNNNSTNYIVGFAGAATTPTVAGVVTSAMPDFTNNTNNVGPTHAAIDATGAAWFDVDNAALIGRNVLTSGANASGTWPVTTSTTGCANLSTPEQMAVVRSGDAIFPNYNGGNGSSLMYITAAGACTELTNASLHAGFTGPFGAAVDGADYVYITNRVNAGTTLSVVNAQAGTAAGTVAVSPASGYQPQYEASGATTLTNMLNGPLNIATDPSGDVWVTNYNGSAIVELIGLAYPTTTPLSVAAIARSFTKGSIGYRP